MKKAGVKDSNKYVTEKHIYKTANELKEEMLNLTQKIKVKNYNTVRT